MLYILNQLYRGIKRRIFKKHNPYRLSFAQNMYFRFRKNKPINSEQLLNGVIRYNCAPYWFRHSYKEIFEEQTYKFAEPGTQPFHIIDCGSNIGLSVIFYKLHYPNARITAIEPDPQIFDLLQANVRQYGFQNVSLLNKAVWINDDAVVFTASGGMGGAVSLGDTGSAKVCVPAVRLKNLLQQPVDFLKIDIEGVEVAVLLDSQPLLHNVACMFVEYHCCKGESQRLNELLTLLQEAGFRYYIRQAYENMTDPFIQKTGLFMDMQLNIFCFRKN